MSTKIAYGIQRMVDPTDLQSFVWHGYVDKFQRNYNDSLWSTENC